MLSTTHFTYFKDEKTFVGELSSLPKSGLTKTSYMSGFHGNKAVEVLELESKSFDLLFDSDRKEYGNLKVTIFND